MTQITPRSGQERAGRQDARRSRDRGDGIRGLGRLPFPIPWGSYLVLRDGTDLPGCGGTGPEASQHLQNERERVVPDHDGDDEGDDGI